MKKRIQIVIELDEGMVKSINENPFGLYNGRLYNAIREGTPLHKEHGRLIDAEELKKEYPHDEDWNYPVNTNSYVVKSIDNSPTIIEASK